MIETITSITITSKIISSAISILNYFGIKPTIFQRKCSWKRILVPVEKLATAIFKCQYKPDIIVAIEGGGMIVAGLLTTNWPYHLGGEFNVVIQRQHYELDNCGKRHKIIPDHIPEIVIKGKKVLLVESVAYSSLTIKEVERIIRAKKPKELKTAVAFRLQESPDIPDFVGQVTKHRQMMPWALTDEYHKRYSTWNQ